MLRGRAAQVELRYRDEAGQIHVEQQEVMTNTPSVTGRRADLPGLVDQPLRSARGRRSADNGKVERQLSPARNGNRFGRTPEKTCRRLCLWCSPQPVARRS